MDLNPLLTEVDRQLGEQRAQVDAFATRAGLMTAIMALLGVLLSGALQRSRLPAPPSLIWLIGAGAALGVLVFLMGRLIMGPSPSQLTRLRGAVVGDDELLNAKIIA